MLPKDYACDGQISLDDLKGYNCLNCRNYKLNCPQESPNKYLCERFKAVPFFFRRQRCQNCKAWTPSENQPPRGWGFKGFCMAHKQVTGEASYCQEFEEEQ